MTTHSPDMSLLLCTDLDRTLLPNGSAPESSQARPLFRALAARADVTIAYVSGRHKQLLLDAIDTYALPVPDFAIGDVGTTIYDIRDGVWNVWEDWSDEIAGDWQGLARTDLAASLDDIGELEQQEAAKQNTYKLSYYAPVDIDKDQVIADMAQRLQARGVRASLIWSIDEAKNIGLLDVLPERATKLHAVEFLMRRKGYTRQRTVFAGDSGNDMPILISGLQAVLVRNASDAVRAEAQRRAPAGSLYVARGGFHGMNGNYAAGILEGLVHYLPDTEDWLSDAGA